MTDLSALSFEAAMAELEDVVRKLESGSAATIQDIAEAEGISDRYVGRMLRLAYLAPTVLDLMGLPQPAEMTGVSLLK